MSFILQGDKILVKPIEQEKKTSSGIILATSEETYKKGEIIHTGPGKYQNGVFIANKIHVGTKILYSYGTPCTIEGKNYELTSDENIIATLK